MIIDLPDTTGSKISKALVTIREEGGAVALGRVLTLVIATDLGKEEQAIEAANDASREHPMRVIVVSTPVDGGTAGGARLDAQIRVGGDAGASEVIVLKAFGENAANAEGLVMGLLLPDAPVVAWWPGRAPEVVSTSPIGRIAQRRITDSAAQADPGAFLDSLAESYAPGDTDFAWTRLTLWRAQLAAVLDQPPFEPIVAVRVSGSSDSPSTLLLAAWLQKQLQVEVECDLTEPDDFSGIHGVVLTRSSGDISLDRVHLPVATLSQPGQPMQDISLPRRSLRDCLAEELRRLDPDDLFGEVITKGLGELAQSSSRK
ncbi:glucose-6-phosphate dehydrogenase assembly protein OpcA [Homoserinimonas aerilata]|uniref:Glucose-6-phosphate dehydrogenase assembly protein OpcA n=1 Tax=Homoserinimonas aerilata TaxID=1162970 RepID=A0A542YIX8_9MICO|nr:glucose-6-phosphate dehydrogenase assembly protein OpcA [Homoserinimonas aerilata]TQL48029.1 glucose-6-phosphate dehydrogenase assembly protein OpcA [Homoserinimonas aerilata]